MSIVVTAGQRGDSPPFETVPEKVRVPRIGPGRPRVRPDRVRADKAYASRKNRAYLRRRGIRCTVPDKADQARNHQRLGSRGGRPPRFDPADYRERHAVECGIKRSRGTALAPRATTSSRSATRRPSSWRPSTNGCDQRVRDRPSSGSSAGRSGRAPGPHADVLGPAASRSSFPRSSDS
ncbi:hypothetical protein [Streptomyces sp. NPDC046870]|uniref:hypothetical protein n=1 Tax=Streptomyces sp. NPDC046870 TaxID=3155135 RepID=UPI0034553CF6